MISTKSLFVQRVKKDYFFQWKAFRLAVDWTVALYIVLPLLLYVVYLDIAAWSQPPSWFQTCSLLTVYIGLFLFSLLGNVRTFIQPADQVIIFQSKAWLSRLWRYAYTFAWIKHAVYSGIVMVYVLPLLVYKELTAIQIVGLWLSLTMFSFWNGLVKRLVFLMSSWWRLWSLRIVAYFSLGGLFLFLQLSLLSQPGFYFGFWIVLLISVYVTNCYVVRKSGLRFLKEIEYEQIEQYRYVAVLLQQAGVPKKVKRRRKPPFFTRFTLYKKRDVPHVLAETFFKSSLRDDEWVKMYLQFCIVTVYGIWTAPVWVGLFLYVTNVCLTAMWGKLLWIGYMHSPYMRMFKWQMGDILQGCRQALMLITLPGSFVVGIIWGFHTSQLPLVLAAIILCVPFSLLVSIIFTRWYKP